METQIQNILRQNTTKTYKMQQLILLGLTRRQIADLVANGNYGFVQNVYAKMRAQGLLNPMNYISGTFNRRFGVEFEAYNVRRETLNQALNDAGISCCIEGYNHTTRSHWKIVTDGSLTGNDTFELVSPILVGERGLRELETVCRVLENCHAKVNKSCGTHVHFDAAGFSLSEWKRIYINYARLEGTIDAFMPVSRRSNNNYYCKGFRNFANFEDKINAARTLQGISEIFGGSRYYKINPVSYSRHNTCEFRQHSGTVEYRKISNWIKFLDALVTLSTAGTVTATSLEELTFITDDVKNYLKERTNQLNR